MNTDTKHGFVYLFRHTGTTHIKIGMTECNDVINRFNSFKTYAPKGAEVVAVLPTLHPRELENKLHVQFADKRLRAEFFNLSEQDIELITVSYGDGRIIECRKAFEVWIADKNNDIVKLTNLLKRSGLADVQDNEDDKKIYEIVENNFVGQYVKPNEILNVISENGINITKLKLGRILHKRYKSIQKRVDKDVFRAYIIN